MISSLIASSHWFLLPRYPLAMLPRVMPFAQVTGLLSAWGSLLPGAQEAKIQIPDSCRPARRSCWLVTKLVTARIWIGLTPWRPATGGSRSCLPFPPRHQGRWREPQLARVPAQRGCWQQSSAMPGPVRTLMLAAMPAARNRRARAGGHRPGTPPGTPAGQADRAHHTLSQALASARSPILPNSGRYARAWLSTVRHAHS
jgi:hypothetical protein